MSTVVYLPPTESVGESLGKGIGSAANAAMKKYEEKKDQDRLMQMQSMIVASANPSAGGSREKALETLTKMPMKNIQEQRYFSDYVNTLAPPKDNSPKEITTYNATTGQPTKSYIRSSDLPKLNTSEGIAQVTGNQGQTLSPIESKDFYGMNPDGSYKAIGRHPVDKRPANAATMDELKLLEQQRTDKLRQEAANRADKKFQLSLDKMATQDDGKASRQITQQLTQMKAYNGVVASMLNVKKSIGQNGEVILDFGGDSKVADAYRKSLENAATYMDKYKGDVNKAAAAALRDTGAFDKPAPEVTAPQAPAKKETGVWESLKNLLSPSKPEAKGGAKPSTTPAKPDTGFIEGKVYTDANGNKAKYVKGKWEPL